MFRAKFDLSEPLAEEDIDALSPWLSEKAGYRVTLRTPARGETKRLCDMAKENAGQRAKEYARAMEKDEKSLVRLAALCGLETVPERIEAFDISNFGDEAITAGMVVYENGKPKKSDYRLFTIKSVAGRDDYASMREAVGRRIAHLNDKGAVPPTCFSSTEAKHTEVPPQKSSPQRDSTFPYSAWSRTTTTRRARS